MNLPMPTHPDYSLILQSIAEGDDQCEELAQRPFEEITPATSNEVLGHLIDLESLTVASMTRIRHVMATIPIQIILAAPEVVFSSLWADAFISGVRFQRLGGHAAD